MVAQNCFRQSESRGAVVLVKSLKEPRIIQIPCVLCGEKRFNRNGRKVPFRTVCSLTGSQSRNRKIAQKRCAILRLRLCCAAHKHFTSEIAKRANPLFFTAKYAGNAKENNIGV